MEKIEFITGQLFVINDFFSDAACDEAILWSEERGYEEAKVQIDGQQVMMKNIRNNSRFTFSDQELADRIWEKLQPFVITPFGNSLAIGLNELFRFYKYESGQRFKRHRDGSYIRNETEASYYTLMIYLNDGFEGGETTFEEHTIVPQKGQALVFEHSLRHAGEPIVSGTKYVLRTDIMYKTGI
ncbi:MAG: prolyl hydroxylase family protein [Fluviicola sp.]